jgi:threonine synthase
VNAINTVASCETCTQSPLVVNYQFLEKMSTAAIKRDVRSMWRYSALLPLSNEDNIISLGEGFTPIQVLKQTGLNVGIDDLILKDESFNPTGSFKARGLSMAISKAKELGIQRCIVPTAGNAGGAMAAYCAKAGIEAVVVMPSHTPKPFVQECEMFGAEVILVDGLISDCAAHVRSINRSGDFFDLSTMKEPYRLEGKKTMGFEIAEQLNWQLPDVILYPTGGGTGLIGMWKAFHEMIGLGWLANKLPRMYAVQAENCEPIVESWLGNQASAVAFSGKPTFANGLAVPNPFAERMILQVLEESGGEPLAISEEEIVRAQASLARDEGILVAPEGAALLPALRRLLKTGKLSGFEQVLLLNTGSGYKYL